MATAPQIGIDPEPITARVREPLKMGAHVKSAEGESSVVGARCSPANHITQYWIEKPDGRRFWARLEELQEPVR
jgi:hypothetical protein